MQKFIYIYYKQILDKMMQSPQFAFYNNEKSIIELSNNGVKLFKNKYLNRPTPYKIENNTYYFDCSYNQIVLYFFPFGKDAKIIEPTNIKDSFKKEYLKAYENYN